MEIVQTFNELYAPVFETDARYILIWGGRGRGGSHFGTDYFLHQITKPDYFRGYLMRQVLGDVRDSLWRDFNDRIESNNTIPLEFFNIQDHAMTAQFWPTGNTVVSKGFKRSSGTQTAKLKSLAGATHVLIEEAEETDEMDFNQLDDSLRTIKADIKIILIFNPPHRDHWIIKRWFNLHPLKKEFEGYYTATPKQNPAVLSIHSTYYDNIENIHPSTIDNFEAYRYSNFEYYATMIRGFVSEGMKGLIYRNWKPIPRAVFDALPYPSYYGLDFGYSNDPAALVELKSHNNTTWVKELLYEVGLTNPALAVNFRRLGVNGTIYADSAEPKSIQELRDMGFDVVPSVKGADSIRAGVNFLAGREVFYTEDSENLISEKQEYRWALDNKKEPTNKPVDKKNHIMDATRYGEYTYHNAFKFEAIAG